MEDLIAAFPNEFFPRHKLTLHGRQGTFSEVGRYDLLFADEFGTQILMELKAVPAKYEHATQLARYKDALRERSTKNTLMWLVAPSIPRSVRDFLDQVGIEHPEIHEAEFRKVAACHDYSFAGEDVIALKSSSPTTTRPYSMEPKTKGKKETRGTVSWFFNTDEGEPEGRSASVRMLENSCIALWEYPDTEKRLSRPAPGERVFLFLNGVGIIATGLFTDEPPLSSNLIFGKQTQMEYLRRVSSLVSVANRSALTFSEVDQMGYRLPRLNSLCRVSNPQIADKMLQELQSRARR